MHRARVVPGWPYYRSGRCRSFLFLWFQSKVSSPGNQAVSKGCQLNISETIQVLFSGPEIVCRHHNEPGLIFTACSGCNFRMVHLLNN
jgi:hypothetical protein